VACPEGMLEELGLVFTTPRTGVKQERTEHNTGVEGGGTEKGRDDN
jgi:hypothetical protein